MDRSTWDDEIIQLVDGIGGHFVQDRWCASGKLILFYCVVRDIAFLKQKLRHAFKVQNVWQKMFIFPKFRYYFIIENNKMKKEYGIGMGDAGDAIDTLCSLFI